MCSPVGRRSPFSLYDKSRATYETGDMFDQTAAKGFIEIFGLPVKVLARVNKKQGKGK